MAEEKQDGEKDQLEKDHLINLWIHYNTTQLQWAPLVIGTALLIIPIILQNGKENIRKPELWGDDFDLFLVAGLPVFLAGIGLCVISYVMYRAQKILKQVEARIHKIDTSFKSMAHPAGRSGAKLLLLFLSFVLAAPMLCFGYLICFGLSLASFLFLVLFLLTIIRFYLHPCENNSEQK